MNISYDQARINIRDYENRVDEGFHVTDTAENSTFTRL